METKYLSKDQLELYIKTFEEKSKFPEKKIPCNNCGKLVSMFNDNLRHRIATFGDAFNLLTKFECRECRKGDKASITVKKKIEKKVEVVDSQTESEPYIPIKMIQSERNVMSFKDIASSKELTAEFTNGTCMQPHMFLNQGRSCKGCIFFENCLCNCKQIK